MVPKVKSSRLQDVKPEEGTLESINDSRGVGMCISDVHTSAVNVKTSSVFKLEIFQVEF